MVVHPGTLHSPGAGEGGGREGRGGEGLGGRRSSSQGTTKGCGYVCACTCVSSQVMLTHWFGWVLAKQGPGASAKPGIWMWGLGETCGGAGRSGPSLFTNMSGRVWVS